MNKIRKNHSSHVLLLAFLAVLLSSLACSTVLDIEELIDPNFDKPDPIYQDNSYAGTYTGEITNTELATGGLLGGWEEQGTVELNEIIIIIAEDGSITGMLSYYKIGNILLSDDGGGGHAECIVSNDHYYVGEATGQQTEDKGRIIFKIQQTITSIKSEGCSVSGENTSNKTLIQHFEIEIIDGEILGTSIPTVEHGHPVKADFRLWKN